MMSLAEFIAKPRFLLNSKSGKVAFAERARSLMEDSGELIERVTLTRPTRHEYKFAADLAESAWEETDIETFSRLWATEAAEAAARTETDTIHLATGLLLPIWNSLPRDYIAVRRVVDAEGNSWLGRLVDESDVPGILKTFGIASEFQASPTAVLAALGQKGSAVIERPWPMTIKRSLVNGEQRIELVGELYSQLAWLKSLGCFTEIIQFKTRIFVPASQADAILASIFKAA
jgi:hypothetical protein